MSAKSLKTTSSILPVRCVWGLLCSLTSIDQERNNISLFNVIEQMNLPSDVFEQHKIEKMSILFPFPHETVLMWRRTLNIANINEDLPVDFKTIIRDPSGKVLQENLATMIIPKDIKRMRFRIRINGIVVTIPGDYQYDIEVRKTNSNDFEKVYEIPFEVLSVNKK